MILKSLHGACLTIVLVVVLGACDNETGEDAATPSDLEATAERERTPSESDDPVENETKAVNAIRLISTAQVTFQAAGTKTDDASIGQYATLEELGAGDSPYLDVYLANGSRYGYAFRVTTGNENGVPTFTATGKPVEPGVSGTKTYFVDETGVIRTRDDGGVADKSSPPL